MGGGGYDGSLYALYLSGPTPAAPANHSAVALLGNIVFLQTIYVPIFGTNSPIWSLANECWYYIIFPMAVTPLLVRRGKGQQLLTVVLLTATLLLLPRSLLQAGLVWAAGAAVALIGQERRLTRALCCWPVRLLAIAIVPCALAAARLTPGLAIDDLVLGLAIAAALPVLYKLPPAGRFYRLGARTAAEISYTVYLTHFPLIALVIFIFFAPYRFDPGLPGTVAYAGLLIFALAWSIAFWWCFERHTDRLYRYLAARLLIGYGSGAALNETSGELTRIHR